MTFIKNSSPISGGNKTRKTTLRKGRVFFFDNYDSACKFCVENNLNIVDIQEKHKSYKIEI